MIERMTQEQLQALKECMEPETRRLAEGIEARNDPAEMADTIALLSLTAVVGKGDSLARGSALDIIKEALLLVSFSTTYKVCRELQQVDDIFVPLLGLEAFDAMKKSVERLATFRELLKPSNAEV